MILSICRHSLLNLMEGKVERAFFFPSYLSYEKSKKKKIGKNLLIRPDV